MNIHDIKYTKSLTAAYALLLHEWLFFLFADLPNQAGSPVLFRAK